MAKVTIEIYDADPLPSGVKGPRDIHVRVDMDLKKEHGAPQVLTMAQSAARVFIDAGLAELRKSEHVKEVEALQ